MRSWGLILSLSGLILSLSDLILSLSKDHHEDLKRQARSDLDRADGHV